MNTSQMALDDDEPNIQNKGKKSDKERKRAEPENNEQTLNLLKSQVVLYEGTFNQLMEETKTSQMNEILTMFINNEEDNYAAFKYINELSDDLDHLQQTKK